MYAIRITRQFFGQADRKSYVTDGFAPNGDEIRAEFKFKAQAEALKAQLEGLPYYTAHNESGAPEYKVVRIK